MARVLSPQPHQQTKGVAIRNYGNNNRANKKRINFDEAKEMQNAKSSFPYVPQLNWPSKREDGLEGQHFNLTQLSFEWKWMKMDFPLIIKYQFTLKPKKQNRRKI